MSIETPNLKDPKERERLFIQYKNLMFKIVNQYSGKLPLQFDDIVGAAMEGFTKALNSYKTGTSQSFQQYAAWCMRNNILTSANEEGHVVKFNAYQQKKAKERGESTRISMKTHKKTSLRSLALKTQSSTTSMKVKLCLIFSLGWSTISPNEIVRYSICTLD